MSTITYEGATPIIYSESTGELPATRPRRPVARRILLIWSILAALNFITAAVVDAVHPTTILGTDVTGYVILGAFAVHVLVWTVGLIAITCCTVIVRLSDR